MNGKQLTKTQNMKRIIFACLSVAVILTIGVCAQQNIFHINEILSVGSVASLAITPLMLSPKGARGAGRQADVVAEVANIPVGGSTAAPKSATTGNGIADLAAAITNASGNASLVDRGQLQVLHPRPTNTTFTVNNVAGSGAAPIVAQMFNEDYLLATPSDNGSGGGSVVKTYNDGFNGNLINRIIGCKGDKGLTITQVQVEMTTNATGLQNTAAVKNASPTLTAHNGDLTALPQNIPLATTGTPAYLQTGFLIINIAAVIQRFGQMSFNVPVGVTASVTVVYA